MPSAYLIWHGVEHGNREDCNIFHEVPEVYLLEEAADARERELQADYQGIPDAFVYRQEVPIGTKLARFSTSPWVPGAYR